MKRVAYYLISILALIFPVNLLIKLSGINVIYPFYHIISDLAPAHIKHLYAVRTKKQFRKDLTFLNKHFIPIQSVPENPLQTNNASFYLSFDDGLKECYDVIFPILKEFNIKGTFFLNSGFTDNKELFFKYKASITAEVISTKKHLSNTLGDISTLLNSKKTLSYQNIKKSILSIKYNERELLDDIADLLNIDFKSFLRENKPYLTSEQILEMRSYGCKLGAHSIDHPLYSEITINNQIEQTLNSISFIQKNYQINESLFAFPFTDDKVRPELFNHLYITGEVEHTFGTAGIKEDSVRRNIQRIPVELHGISAERSVKTEYLLYILKKMIAKHRINR